MFVKFSKLSVMCYHVSIPDKGELIKQLPSYQIEGDFQPFYHISGFARPFVPVTTNAAPTLIRPARWKLIPSWIKTDVEAGKYANTLNAHCDEIFLKPSYKSYIGRKHGLLWVNGFFEPHKVEGIKETENYFIYKPEKQIFSLGVVWSPFIDSDTGETYDTFSIITTAASKMLAEIHNEKKRMPLVISPDQRDQWLNATDKETVNDFFHPSGEEFYAHKIAHRVTAAKKGFDTNFAEIQNPAT